MEVCLGRIINVRGLKGELKINLSTEFVKKRFKKGEKVILFNEETKDRREVTCFSYGQSANFLFLRTEEILDVDTANKYRNYLVLKDVTDTPKDSYYYFELLNKPVYMEDRYLGKVINIESNGVQKLLRLDSNKLIPFVDAFIKEVNEDKILINSIGGI